MGAAAALPSQSARRLDHPDEFRARLLRLALPPAGQTLPDGIGAAAGAPDPQVGVAAPKIPCLPAIALREGNTAGGSGGAARRGGNAPQGLLPLCSGPVGRA